MDPAVKKAEERIEKADKKLKSWFASFSGGKYEDAEELYSKAANQLKVAKQWDRAGAAFEKAAACHVKMESAHEAARSYQDAALCYKKTNTAQAVLLYKEAVSIHIDLGRFTTAAKVQKEIGELYEAEGDTEKGMEAYQTAADYYQAEENNSTANQMLLKVADLASTRKDYKRAVEIYEQVAIASLESNLLKFSVKNYLFSAGLCRLAIGELGAAVDALDRYDGMDATFAGTREGMLLREIAAAFEGLDEDAFTAKVREFDEIQRLDAQKTSLLLEIKNAIKNSVEDIT